MRPKPQFVGELRGQCAAFATWAVGARRAYLRCFIRAPVWTLFTGIRCFCAVRRPVRGGKRFSRRSGSRFICPATKLISGGGPPPGRVRRVEAKKYPEAGLFGAEGTDEGNRGDLRRRRAVFRVFPSRTGPHVWPSFCSKRLPAVASGSGRFPSPDPGTRNRTSHGSGRACE